MQWRWPLVLSGLVVLLGITPLYAQAPESAPDAGPGAAVSVEARHLVQASDNLHLLAAYYYGDARQWVQIFAANRGGIKHPSVIHPGQILRINLSGDWNPPEPYAAWKRRIHETAAALKATAETPGQPSSPPRTGPIVIGPSMLREEPSAPAPESPEPPEGQKKEGG
jgi:hypothetical protein